MYQAVDSSYLLLDTNNATNYTLKSSDGTQLSYVYNGSYYVCTRITDRNGNFITIAYAQGRIDKVTDTLGHEIKFNYAPNVELCSNSAASGDLCSVTQTWTINGEQQTHYWARFAYADRLILANWQSGLTVNGPQYGSTIRALTDVTLAHGSRYHFDYSVFGQVKKIYSIFTSMFPESSFVN